MPSKPSSHHHTKHTSSPLQSYHSDVMHAMCTQMVHHRRPSPDSPLPLAKKPATSRTHQLHNSSRATQQPKPQASVTTSSKSSSAVPFTQHVREEMARRVKADRVLQDLSSDKSRQQATARETARRNKWAKTVATTCPPAEVPVVKKTIASYGYSTKQVGLV